MTVPPQLIDRLKSAQRVVVLTGAGVSAESGVPTFRDAQTGLWSKFNPEELATPRAFRRNPRLVWEWYEYRRKLVAEAKPNPAHTALAEMERLFPEFHLVTQNIDGLHQRAGSRNVVELHGNITRTKCFDEGTIVSNWTETGDVPPKCPNCGGLLRSLLFDRNFRRGLSRRLASLRSTGERSNRGGNQSAVHTTDLKGAFRSGRSGRLGCP
jgi:NAD-dependent deacetylase